MTEWFKKWFSSDEYLSVYSHRNENDANNIIKLILSNYPLNKKLDILDAACGAGRHSILLSNMGHNVVSFDLSKNLLKIGLENSKELNADVKFICSDIRNFNVLKSFDLVLNMFTSFGYFDDDVQNFIFYKNIKKLLKPDALIVLDYLNVKYLDKNIVPFSSKLVEGKLIEEKRRIENGKVIKDINIINNGIEHSYHESVKLYTLDRLQDNFQKLGYKIVSKYGDYNGSDYKEDNSQRLILFIKNE